MENFINNFILLVSVMVAAPFSFLTFYILYKWITYSDAKYAAKLPVAKVPDCYQGNTFAGNAPMKDIAASVVMKIGCVFLSFVSISCIANGVVFFMEIIDAPSLNNLMVAVLTSIALLSISVTTGYFAFCLYKISKKEAVPVTDEDYYEFKGYIQNVEMKYHYHDGHMTNREDCWEVDLGGVYFYFPPTLGGDGGFPLLNGTYTVDEYVKIGFVNRRSQLKHRGVCAVGIEKL